MDRYDVYANVLSDEMGLSEILFHLYSRSTFPMETLHIDMICLAGHQMAYYHFEIARDEIILQDVPNAGLPSAWWCGTLLRM